MGLIALQEFLAHLYTSSSFREGFFADPETTARRCGLPPGDLAVVSQLSPSQVDLFARSLQRKRRGEVAKLLPMTRSLLGERFPDLFLRFAEDFVPAGIHKHRDDALAFCAYLKTAARTDGIEPAWSVDAAGYEGGWLEASNEKRCLLVRRFSHSIPEMVSAHRASGGSIEPRRRATVGLWWRWRPRRRLHHALRTLG